MTASELQVKLEKALETVAKKRPLLSATKNRQRKS